MLQRLVFLACLGVAGCRGSDATAPDQLRVASLSYTATPSCGAPSCGGILRFRLVTQSDVGRSGSVTIVGDGVTPTIRATTGSDGWGQTKLAFEPPASPHSFTVCPAGVTDMSRCATGSTG